MKFLKCLFINLFFSFLLLGILKADILPDDYYDPNEYRNHMTFQNINLTGYLVYFLANGGSNIFPVQEGDFVSTTLVLIKENEVSDELMDQIDVLPPNQSDGLEKLKNLLPSDTIVIELPPLEYEARYYSSGKKGSGRYREIIYMIENDSGGAKVLESLTITHNGSAVTEERKKYDIHSISMDEYFRKETGGYNVGQVGLEGLIGSEEINLNEEITNTNEETTSTNEEINSNDRGVTKSSFFIAWSITVFLELFVLLFLCKILFKNDNIKNGKIVFIGILASTITLPLLRFVLPLFIKDEMWYAVIGELLVTSIEVFIIKYGLKISRKKAILASIICNLCSYLCGLIVS